MTLPYRAHELLELDREDEAGREGCALSEYGWDNPKEWSQGWDAFGRNEPIKSCPFKEGEEQDAWLAGWLCAKQDFEEGGETVRDGRMLF